MADTGSPDSEVYDIGPTLVTCGTVNVTSFAALADLRFLRGSLQVRRAVGSAITNLSGLEGLVEAESIIFSQEIESLLPLRNLERCSGQLGLGGTLSEDFGGFESLLEVGELSIDGNPVLTNLSGLARLERVRGTILIPSNPMLPESQVQEFFARVEAEQKLYIE